MPRPKPQNRNSKRPVVGHRDRDESAKVFRRLVPLRFVKRQDDKGQDVYEVAISSQTDDVRRWFGREILVHTRRAIDLSRLRSVAGVLFNHDPDRIVGPILSARVDTDRVLRVSMMFDDTDEGQTRKKQVDSGSLRGASLSYTYDAQDFDDVAEGRETKLDGQVVIGPARIVRRWTPLEPTLTPMPADASVGVGRAMDAPQKTMEHRVMKWKIVAADGSIERRFATKKEALAFIENDDSETEWETVVRMVTPPVQKSPTPASGEPEETEGASTPNEEEIALRVARRHQLIREIGDMCKMREFADELIVAKPNIDAADAQRQIHTRWKEDRVKNNKPVNNVEPSAPNNGARRLKDVNDDDLVSALSRSTLNPITEPNTGMLSSLDLRALVSNDEGNFERRIQALFADKKLRGNQLNLRTMYQVLAGMPVRQLVKDAAGDIRAVTTSAFAVLTGTTMVTMLREAYDAVPRIADLLTTLMPSNNETDTIPAVLSEDVISKVAEGKDFPEGGAVEEHVTIGHQKQGGIVSVTREMIQFDKTGQFFTRINRMGEAAANVLEQLVIERVTDSISGEFVYNPNGTGTALYSTTARARGTNKLATNALVDSSDLDNLRALLRAMTNHAGKPILVRPDVVLVPDGLLTVADKITLSELTPGAENELNPWGPRGRWRPRVLSSPFLDVISGSTWYMGNPAKQFVRKQVFGIEVTTRGAGSDAEFSSDIVFAARAAFDEEIGATDYVFFVQSTA